MRIIEYTLTDPIRVGCGETHRLLTTLLNETLDLVVLYHERWEEELAIDELKTHQRERAVLRSHYGGGRGAGDVWLVDGSRLGSSING